MAIRKTLYRGIKFDSKAEAEYYDLALWQAQANGWKVKLQERFELMPKFELDGKEVSQDRVYSRLHIL